MNRLLLYTILISLFAIVADASGLPNPNPLAKRASRQGKKTLSTVLILVLVLIVVFVVIGLIAIIYLCKRQQERRKNSKPQEINEPFLPQAPHHPHHGGSTAGSRPVSRIAFEGDWWEPPSQSQSQQDLHQQDTRRSSNRYSTAAVPLQPPSLSSSQDTRRSSNRFSAVPQQDTRRSSNRYSSSGGAAAAATLSVPLQTTTSSNATLNRNSLPPPASSPLAPGSVHSHQSRHSSYSNSHRLSATNSPVASLNNRHSAIVDNNSNTQTERPFQIPLPPPSNTTSSNPPITTTTTTSIPPPYSLPTAETQSSPPQPPQPNRQVTFSAPPIPPPPSSASPPTSFQYSQNVQLPYLVAQPTGTSIYSTYNPYEQSAMTKSTAGH